LHLVKEFEHPPIASRKKFEIMAVSQLRIFLGWNQIELGMTEDEIVKK